MANLNGLVLWTRPPGTSRIWRLDRLLEPPSWSMSPGRTSSLLSALGAVGSFSVDQVMCRGSVCVRRSMREWPHVDDMVAVEDPDQRGELEATLQARLVQDSLDGIFLGLPDEAEGFAKVMYGTSHDTHEEFDLLTALGGWRGNVASLRSRPV